MENIAFKYCLDTCAMLFMVLSIPYKKLYDPNFLILVLYQIS